MPPVHLRKVTIAGVGLLGASLGLALKQRGLATKIDGLVRRTASIRECESLRVVDHATRDPVRAAQDAELIVICTPIARMRDVVQAMAPGFKPGVIVTDVGSVKDTVVRDLEPLVTAAGGHFVGSHPLAGTENTGPSAAQTNLFEDALCVLTPTPRTSPIALRRIEELWRNVGAHCLRLRPEIHDDLVSRSSHLPHIVAASLANYVLSPAHPKEQYLLCATGFRDTTRVASSGTEMWRDILLANRENLLRVLGVFIEDLQEFRHTLEQADARAIEEFLNQARSRRDAWTNTKTSPSPD
jgi:prephenate dehydrogenase